MRLSTVGTCPRLVPKLGGAASSRRQNDRLPKNLGGYFSEVDAELRTE